MNCSKNDYKIILKVENKSKNKYNQAKQCQYYSQNNKIYIFNNTNIKIGSLQLAISLKHIKKAEYLGS